MTNLEGKCSPVHSLRTPGNHPSFNPLPRATIKLHHHRVMPPPPIFSSTPFPHCVIAALFMAILGSMPAMATHDENTGVDVSSCVRWSPYQPDWDVSKAGDGFIRVGGVLVCRARRLAVNRNELAAEWKDTCEAGPAPDQAANPSACARQSLVPPRSAFDVGRVVFGGGESNDEAAACLIAGDAGFGGAVLFDSFEVARRDEQACSHFWVHMSDDVNPLNPTAVLAGRSTALASDLAICRYEGHIGRMFMQGERFGHCGYVIDGPGSEEVLVGGGYESMSAWPTEDSSLDPHGTSVPSSEHEVELVEAAVAAVGDRVKRFLTPDDRRMIQRITSTPVDVLVAALRELPLKALNLVLSMERFIPHGRLNNLGLAVLRSVLAERMTNARRRQFGLDSHPDTAEWEHNGVLLKDFDHLLAHPDELTDLLRMVAASNDVPESIRWVERNVTASANDPQRRPHIDTFHSVVKLWVYERGVVSLASGPLHFMVGSQRSTEAKLRWIYDYTQPPASEAIKEPSFRFDGASAKYDLPAITPVLPNPDFARTLIVADTSGIHHRGPSVPGTVRRTIRVQDGLDGGIPRLDPFNWEAWDHWSPLTATADDDAATHTPAV